MKQHKTRVRCHFWLGLLLLMTSPSWGNVLELRDKQDRPMPGMVVYLESMTVKADTLPHESASGAVSSAPENQPSVEVHQQGKRFIPYINLVHRGQQVAFINDDDITHHIYSALGPARFSFKLRAGQQHNTLAFDVAGEVSMGCNIHDWMSGHLLVLDSPYFGISGSAGEISLDSVPPGEYRLVVWHPQLQAQGHRQVSSVHFPLESPAVIRINADMAPLPQQQGLDDFEFLEGY